MAQVAAMGPPLSPRETRRSGRRSVPSASASNSKSPTSPPPDSAPRTKDSSTRPSLSTSSSSSRNKRFKQEDIEDSVNEPSQKPAQAGITPHVAINSRAKRKAKEKDTVADGSITEKHKSTGDDALMDGQDEEEEQGITRCVCGSTGEDDPEAGEFMVQCETCQVWQHGLCMGYESEDQLHDDDYYCEQCRPELHVELLKKLSKRIRQSSANSHNTSTVAQSRLSRSHSPSHPLKQPSKRRNTMNSRDAAFDESLKEIIEATAAEAAAYDSRSVASNGNTAAHIDEDDGESSLVARKKRKRAEEDALPKKRTRSASSASDHPMGSNPIQDETPQTVNGGNAKATNVPVTATKPHARNRRGGGNSRKPAVHEVLVPVEGEESVPPKRQSNNSRTKTSNAPKRPPASHASLPPGSAHEHGTRRNQSSSVNGPSTGPTTAESSRAYRNSHAYVVSQQPLFTSWNLPDYLAHLEPMLPTDTPKPLEVRVGLGFAVTGGGWNGMEKTVERGVKVKWPSKRTSVGDMNKRVRALVEWVGREQASALDRGRRRDALEKALIDAVVEGDRSGGSVEHPEAQAGADGTMMLDQDRTAVSPIQDTEIPSAIVEVPSSGLMKVDSSNPRSSTMKLMEQLMEELIGFQERFGPGAKSRERERRLA